MPKLFDSYLIVICLKANHTEALENANLLMKYVEGISEPSHLVNRIYKYQSLQLYIELLISWDDTKFLELTNTWNLYINDPERTEELVAPYTVIADFIELKTQN